jgi:ankyrin repeat protein
MKHISTVIVLIVCLVVLSGFSKDRRIYTHLLQNAASGNPGHLVEELIRLGADVNYQDDSGFSALHWAAFSDNITIVKLLIQAGADVNARTDIYDLRTPLFMTPESGYEIAPEITNLLLENGADPNAQNAELETPLHYVCYVEADPADQEFIDIEIQILKNLIAGGANVNIANTRKETPLFQAVIANRKDCIEILINAGADITVKDDQGKTPLDYGTKEVKAFLKSLKKD